jgi:hypothetical protein
MIETLSELIKQNRTLVVLAAILLSLVYVPSARAGAKLVLRALARLLLLLALIALISDGTRTIANDSGLVVTSTLQYASELTPNLLENIKRTLSLKIHPLMWDGFMVPLLRLPAWLFLAALAMLMLLVGRKRRETNIFVNV